MGRKQRKLAKIKAKEELQQIKQVKKQEKAEKRKSNQQAFDDADPMAKGIAIGIVAVIVLVIAVASGLSSSDTPEPLKKAADKPKATYTAKVNDTKVVDPATLIVSVAVKNTNKTEGKPSCWIEAKSANGTYRGYDSFEMNDRIPAGQKRGLTAKLTITKEGAAFVTDVTADCA